MIAADLLARISERADDPRRRTADASLASDAQPLDLQKLMGDLSLHSPAAPQLQGMLGGLSKLFGGMGGLQQQLSGMVMAGPGGTHRFGDAPAQPANAAPPPDEQALAAAEQRIGRPLPPDLRQLYAIADGGFGPAGGLFPLAETVRRYEGITDGPFGPAGQSWPRNLLPVFDYNPQWLCIDLDDGKIICWDPERIEDEDSEEDWQGSFVPEADSLAALMETWLAEPTTAERMEQSQREMAEHVPQATIDFYAAMTPEERAGYGFVGEDWEDQLRRQFRESFSAGRF